MLFKAAPDLCPHKSNTITDYSRRQMWDTFAANKKRENKFVFSFYYLNDFE